MKHTRSALLTLAATALPLVLATSASAEPTEPVVIGWWSFFDTVKAPTTSSAAHQVTSYGDPDTYYYEPSGGHGLQEDPALLPPDQAWQSIVSFVLAKSNTATLSPTFTIQTTSDLNAFTEAYFGWALVLLYVPKDKYCDGYRIHVGSVDDGVQAMANGKILGYANLGESDKYIDMVAYGSNPPQLVLRPGINEVVIIHEDQAAVERYVTNVWIEHDGVQIGLAPKSIALGRALDAASLSPLYDATVTLGGGPGGTFKTGPFGFYFFDGLADGSYGLTADAAGYKTQVANVAVALGQGATEVVTTDLLLEQGCSCPAGTECGPSGGCLSPCVMQGEVGEGCADPAATCVNHLCVEDPCDTLTCPPGFACEPVGSLGLCVEIACSNVCCGAGEVCSAGLCVPDSCGAACPDGQTCAGGNCVDSCTIVDCVDNLVCVEGACVSPCVADPSLCGGGVGGFGFGGGGGEPTAAGAGGATGGAGAGGSPSLPLASGEDGGCGCRVGSAGRHGGWALAMGALGAAVAIRRRGRGLRR